METSDYESYNDKQLIVNVKCQKLFIGVAVSSSKFEWRRRVVCEGMVTQQSTAKIYFRRVQNNVNENNFEKRQKKNRKKIIRFGGRVQSVAFL